MEQDRVSSDGIEYKCTDLHTHVNMQGKVASQHRIGKQATCTCRLGEQAHTYVVKWQGQALWGACVHNGKASMWVQTLRKFCKSVITCPHVMLGFSTCTCTVAQVYMPPPPSQLHDAAHYIIVTQPATIVTIPHHEAPSKWTIFHPNPKANLKLISSP